MLNKVFKTYEKQSVYSAIVLVKHYKFPDLKERFGTEVIRYLQHAVDLDRAPGVCGINSKDDFIAQSMPLLLSLS